MLVQTKPKFPNTPIAKIPLQNGMTAFCDPKWLEQLSTLHWHAKKSRSLFYACSKVHVDGKIKFIRMHQLIAHTPPNQVCHHINGNSLDNREANLRNMSEFEHAKYYSYR